MQGEPRIKWVEAQRKRLDSAVRRYNNAIRREAKRNPANAEFLPAEASYRELKASITCARNLNNTVNRLLRAARPGALELTRVGEGGITTKYEVKEFQILKAVNERRKAMRRRALGIDYGQTLGRMGTIRENQLAPDTRTVHDFTPRALRRFIARQEELMAQSSAEKIRIYYANYITGLYNVFGGDDDFEEGIRTIQDIIRGLADTDPKKLLDIFESGDEIVRIEYLYSWEQQASKMDYLLSKWSRI